MKKFSPFCYLILNTCFLLISFSSNSQSFSHPSIITGDLMHSLSGNDFIGVVYSRLRNVYYNQLYSAGVWGEEAFLGTSSAARLAIDSSDRPHVIYTEATICV